MEKLLSEIKQEYHDKILIIYDNNVNKNLVDSLFELIFNIMEEKYTIFKTLDLENDLPDELFSKVSNFIQSNYSPHYSPYIVRTTKNKFNIKLIEHSTMVLLVHVLGLKIMKNRYGKSNYQIDIKSFSRKIKLNKLLNKYV